MKQIIATTLPDAHGDVFALSAFDSVLRQLNDGDRRPAIMVQHDRTLPPLGKMVGAEVVPLNESDFALVSESAFFDCSEQVTLDDGTTLIHECSSSNPLPLVTAIFDEGSGICVRTDRVNFASWEEAQGFLARLEENAPGEISTGIYGRKSAIPDPEIIFTLTATIAGAWLGGTLFREFGKKIGERAGEVVSQDAEVAYRFLRDAAVEFASKALPKNRPQTYVFQFPGETRVELVAQVAARDVEKVMDSLLDAALEDTLGQAKQLSERFDGEYVQFLFDAASSSWKFNYLLTKTGGSIGTPVAYVRRAAVLTDMQRQIERRTEQQSGTPSDHPPRSSASDDLPQ